MELDKISTWCSVFQVTPHSPTRCRVR